MTFAYICRIKIVLQCHVFAMQICARQFAAANQPNITNTYTTKTKLIQLVSLVSVFLTSQIYITHNYFTSAAPGRHISADSCLSCEIPHHQGAVSLAHSHQTRRLVTSGSKGAEYSTTGVYAQGSGSASVTIRRRAAQRVSE